MTTCKNKIGLAFTGDSQLLEAFFSTGISKDNDKNSLLNLLKREVIESKAYYCFFLENFEWNEEAELERRALCGAANEAKLSFHFCYFNTESFKTVTKSNMDSPYFDYDVWLFGVSKIGVFQDTGCPTFKDWMLANLGLSELENIRSNGATNCVKLQHRCQLLPLYEQYHTDIWEILETARVKNGHKTVFESDAIFLSSVCNDWQFKMSLAWSAAERVAVDVIGLELFIDNPKENGVIDE